MDIEKEFIERFGMALMRFEIKDRFHPVDTKIARLAIAKHALQVLADLVKEEANEPVESNGPIDSINDDDRQLGEEAARWEDEGGASSSAAQLSTNEPTNESS